MKEYSNQVRVVFRNRKEDIPLNLNLCLEKINNHTNSPIDASILSRIKWVITEMISNGAKHAHIEESLLKITIDDYQLTIEKEDQGKPLVLTELESGRKITWPLDYVPIDPDFQIYQNGIDLLIARATECHRVVFFVEELKGIIEPENVLFIAEHFGLLIMAKASDDCAYEYDTESNTNRFTSSFKLNVI